MTRVLPLVFLTAVATAFATNVSKATPEIVAISEQFPPGTIVVRTNERQLYYIASLGKALRYPVGVGREGRRRAGFAYITAKYTDPSWIPPSHERRNKPHLPPIVPGGSPENPMGVAALTLSGGEYTIHGTNDPSSIGRVVPYGCVRMFNEDMRDLYHRVGVGTQVIVQ